MFRFAFIATIALTLAGCVTKPAPDTSIKTSSVIGAESPRHDDDAPAHPRVTHHLLGRTLTVSSIHEIKLEDKELILTFDDGPIPGKTERVLATLEEFGVKGAFMMVGEMAQAHPALARRVADEGNAIGSHTFRHADLHSLSFDMAMAEITKGEAAVTKATGADVGFFRFPYLADTRRLRAAIAMRNMIVMDVDIDSKDYYDTSPAAVTQRTMKLIHQQGRGIVLMHDIHKRTANMLPTLLIRLEKEGYKIVTLQYKRTRMPTDLVAFGARHSDIVVR